MFATYFVRESSRWPKVKNDSLHSSSSFSSSVHTDKQGLEVWRAHFAAAALASGSNLRRLLRHISPFRADVRAAACPVLDYRVLQNHCISGDIRTTLLLGQHTQLRNGPTVTINDTIAAPPVSLPSQTLSNCLRELENFDSIVGCAFLINDETRLLEEVSEKSKEFLIALRKCFVAKGIADVEKAMLDKASKLVFISLWGGVLKTEARTPYSSCMKSSILCHRVAYSENLLGPESKDENTSDDIQFMGTTASAKRKRGARASDSDFSHIKSQDVDLRIWSGEGSLVHDFDKNFPAFVMPALDVGVSGKLQGLFTRLEKSNTELHEDIVTELEHCRHLAHEYGKDFDLRSGLSSATNRRPTSDCDASLKPS